MPESDPSPFVTSILHHVTDPYRLLVESIRDYAVYMLNPQGCVATWNTGAERMRGFTAPEILGKHFSVLFTAEDVAAGRPDQILSATLANATFEEEGYRPRKDGSVFWANYSLTALFDGDRHVGYGGGT
jgi:PAS domain S-box-containing protein